jgi:hypothetical protein
VSESTAGQGRLRQARPWTLRVALGATLAAVIAAPELAAWHGLLGLARDKLGLTGTWAVLVPLMFGLAAAYCALLAVRHVLAGDSAVTERALTWIYAAGGAGFNAYQAEPNVAAAVFFAGASLSAALLWDRTLRAWRRDELRAAGALERPLPRFRLLRWLVAPSETWDAWHLAVREGVTSPDEALARARAAQEGSPVPVVRREGELVPAPELDGLTKRDALLAAWRSLQVWPAKGDLQVDQALAWLSARGWSVNTSYAYSIARDVQDKRLELVSASGER